MIDFAIGISGFLVKPGRLETHICRIYRLIPGAAPLIEVLWELRVKESIKPEMVELLHMVMKISPGWPSCRTSEDDSLHGRRLNLCVIEVRSSGSLLAQWPGVLTFSLTPPLLFFVFRGVERLGPLGAVSARWPPPLDRASS